MLRQRPLGFHWLSLAAGASGRVTFDVHSDRLSCTGRRLVRIVEPGDVRFAVGGESEDLRLSATVSVTARVGPGSPSLPAWTGP